MKKIFAIALALVMVLSMASAFAAQCVTPNWACAEDVCALGKGKVEVIPYVKGNDCNTGNTWTVSTCAGAVNGDRVYFAVKVTVDENANTEWWADAALTAKFTGLSDVKVGKDNSFSTFIAADGKGVDGLIKAQDTKGQDDLIAGEYYIVFDGAWKAVKAADFSAKEAYLYSAKVDEAAAAKVCVSLVADEAVAAKVNGYDVSYTKDATNPNAVLTFTKDGKTVFVCVDADDKIVKFSVTDGTTTYEVKTFNYDGTKFFCDTNKKDVDWTCDPLGKFLKGVMDSFNLAFQTCITDKAVKANFGWDDEVKSCFSWSSNVQAVVDAECVVAIPKTGDASVLAWLF